MKNEHHYRAHLIWDGNRGDGTATYAGYGREYRVRIDGKPDIHGTADVAFRGEADKLNPEDLFVAAITSCHMLSYLALCAKYRIRVVAYEDEATAVMREDGRGGGKFDEVALHPVVTIAEGDDADRALELHDRAHAQCFIASSCSVPILHRPVILRREDAEGSPDAKAEILRSAQDDVRVKDLAIALDDRPGALAEMGEALGRAGVSIEGGGVFVANGAGVAHFLVRDAHAAREALDRAGIRVIGENEVLVQKLRQDEAGQLGKIARRMAEAGVNIQVQYSDHDHNLILVVDDLERGRAVSAEWTRDAGRA